ncbi:PKD domain-containing protein [Methanobacterium congolense]|uniref:Protease 1 n=1 Tax=Methanobacterium congolense TaxID=118062 RepID=A0A1D3KZL1_9EURY|nr:PKD domain-containing protein [Methanobacterium congolense]SCG84728.1 Protease 1 [Methanobacterium congolense]
MKKYIFLTISFLMILGLCGSAAAAETGSNYMNLTVANDNGARFSDLNDSYTFFNRSADGVNALKITDNSSAATGKVVNTTSQSGTFYITSIGGKGYEDDVILMLAVNGTVPANFQLHVTASGYQWTPKSGAPSVGDLSYNSTTLDETFYASDFIYGPQIYKPCNLVNYPIYEYQNMTNSSNTFMILFIDLYAGILNNAALNDMGMVKIQYSFQNLPVNSLAAFNAFSYRKANAAVQWTNKVNVLGGTEIGTSGYNVLGAAPTAAFSANTTSGSAPLNVQFTDSSIGTPTSWLWDFGDGVTSTEQNPTHTYTKPGNYTVTLTTSNAAGSSTQTTKITVLKSDVYVNIIPSNSNPQIGDTVTYKFKLGNNGPGIAKNVTFTYTIPEGLEYEGAIVDQGTVTYNTTTRTLTWNLGDVAVGDPNLWLQLKVLQAGNYNIQPTVTVGGTTLESNINSLQVNAASPSTETVNAATTTKTVPMKTTGMPITALISALLMIGSGIAISRKK